VVVDKKELRLGRTYKGRYVYRFEGFNKSNLPEFTCLGFVNTQKKFVSFDGQDRRTIFGWESFREYEDN